MAVAQRVEEAVDGRPEGTQPHEIRVDEVDADFHAEQVGGYVAHGAGDERIEQR